MKPTRHAIAMAAAMLAASAATAQQQPKEPQTQEEGMKVTGSVTGGLITSRAASRNPWKADEYRDLSDGVLIGGEVKGRSPDYYLDGFGENLNRNDQTIDVKGGKYNSFRWQLYDSRLVHNWTHGAITPYSGVGSNNLVATFPSLNTANWNTFDFSKKRENIGGMFEAWAGSPWFLRVDANEVRERGLQLIAGSNGTSPGNGFTDKPFPVDYRTVNGSIEAGYATKTSQFSVNLLHSSFNNANDTLRWNNGFFANGQDTTYLAPDNVHTKIGLNGALKQLPFGTTLSGRATWARTTNNPGVATSALDTGGAVNATNPNASNFSGDVVHQTFSVSAHSNWTSALDSRVYWNWFKKDNDSTEVTFTPAATSGLTCGGGACVTDLLSYRKNNVGAEAGYRLTAANRVVAGLDYVDLNRNRSDYDRTQDTRASLEWRNTSLDWMNMRLKYQYLQRRSHFLEGSAGVNGSDPNFLDRFIAKFDAANVDQNLIKAIFDFQPADRWDLGLETILKQNKYKDTTLGRLKDDRQQLYGSIAYGDMNSFRVMLFGDVEFVKYDSLHRNISQTTAAGGVTSTAIYDPNAPAQCNGGNCNYNWNATNKDRNWALGIGTDWLPVERLKINASAIWQWAKGTADFAVQQTPNPINPAATPIQNFDNMQKFSLNLKGIYAVTKQIDVTAGYAFEKYKYSDIALDGYQYTIGTGTGASYLSGAYAFPNYTLNLFYLTGTLKF
ncbi:MAG TPA: MtrB/PioB family outer membrane beta-barrel protein [Burkholderiales bacterium]|nr:MtrB/PioB family outer membrane beta-barrel protein [Burkholderiales bacterium]